ncbi:MAG: ComF family protein [Sphingobacteriales bacterium]|nr:MAG: ComF family protein [Sphingobacteriales bacterium]
MLQFFKTQVYYPVLDLLFPKYCIACETLISAEAGFLCLSCKHTLPYTDMEKMEENTAQIRMLTRLPVQFAASLLYFVDAGMVRAMLHKLKYQNRPEIGSYLGELMAQKFASQAWFRSVDAIVPVPLHPAKKVKRGYNQSACIAEGIASYSRKPMLLNAVKRIRNTSSQTDKNRKERMLNVADAFTLHRANQIEGKHILLVDDVLTTGATLGACGRSILTGTNCTLSIATAAIAYY